MKSLIFNPLIASANATSFLLVRHGETDWNAERRVQGHADIPLNETGRTQAIELGKLLRDYSFNLCIASDLKRAQESAAFLTNLDVQTDRRLRERTFNSLEGKLFGECLDQIENEAEKLSCLGDRIFECLEELAMLHPGKQILVATHGGVLRKILIDILSLSCPWGQIATSNMATLHITYLDGKWSVENYTGITLPDNLSASLSP